MLITFSIFPSKLVIYVSAVRVHILVASRVTFTVPTSVEITVPLALVISPLTVPSNELPSVRFRFRVESLPTRIVYQNVHQ